MSQAPARPRDVFDQPVPPRKKSRFWRNFTIAALVSMAVGAGAALFTKEGATLRKGVETGFAVYQDPDLIFNNVGSDHVNILLIGEDRNWVIKPVFNPRTGKSAPLQVIDTETPPRSDTMIIASLDKNSRKIRMISLPRDARVRYRDLDGKRHKAKLNSVYASGGKDPLKRQEVLKKFLATEMGVRIDRVSLVKLEGFTNLVDEVGGVEVNVDGALKMKRSTGKLYRGDIDYTDNWGKWEVHLKPGKQILNGEQAHGYVRFRYDREGDPGRIRRQQQVMQAIAKTIMSKSKLELPKYAAKLKEQFNADMTDEEMASAALFAKNMQGGVKISPLTTFGTYASNGDVILNKPENEKLFAAIFGSSFDAKNFLKRSPWTERDEIGHVNNSNPGALAVLREAGLVKDDEVAKNPVLEAPVEESGS